MKWWTGSELDVKWRDLWHLVRHGPPVCSNPPEMRLKNHFLTSMKIAQQKLPSVCLCVCVSILHKTLHPSYYTHSGRKHYKCYCTRCGIILIRCLGLLWWCNFKSPAREQKSVYRRPYILELTLGNKGCNNNGSGLGREGGRKRVYQF